MRLTSPSRYFVHILGAAVTSAMLACTTTSLSGPDASVAKCQVALTGPQSAVGAGGGTGTVSVVAAPECQWTAASDASWISDLAPASGQGPAQIQFKAAANPAASTRQGDITVNGTATHVNQDPAACVFDVAPRTLSVTSVAGSGSVNVTSPTGCAWTAVPEVPWLTLTSPAQSSGTAPVTFAIAANPAALVRVGSITVAGIPVIVTQQPASCGYVLNPPTQNIPVGGGSGTVGVTSGPACTWTATADVPWIAFAGSTSGTAGGSVNFTVSTNTGSPRTGHVTIGGVLATVEQAGIASCSFSISPSSQSISDSGGSGSTAVTATPGCSWSATSNASWITITSGATGASNGSVAIAIAANSGAARTGTVSIAGQIYTVNQSAAPCNFNVAPLSQSVPNTAGAVTPVGVTTASHCSWTAVSNDSWIQVTSGASGAGTGSVGISVQLNSGALRSGTLTIAGKTVTIEQAAVCAFNVSPLNQTIGALGGAGTAIGVTAASGCAWNAAVNPSDGWIHIPPGASGTGNGSVQITIDINLGAARSGSLTVAGQTVHVSQDAVLCSYTINSNGQNVSSGSGAGTDIAVTAPVICGWTAAPAPADTWLHVTSGASGTGNGTVQWSFDANPGAARTGTMTVATKTFTVMQDGVACSFSINPTSRGPFANTGGSDTIAVTANLSSCSWTAVSGDPSWLTIDSGTPGTGSGGISYTVAPNGTLAARQTMITIAGQTFTVDQDQ